MAWPLFLVQTKAATPFHPPPLWELQFRGDRFLLGSAARHLSPCRIWRMHCDIRCVTATSSNRNLTLRRRANLRLPRRDRRSRSRRAISTGRSPSAFSALTSAACARAVGLRLLYFPRLSPWRCPPAGAPASIRARSPTANAAADERSFRDVMGSSMVFTSRDAHHRLEFSLVIRRTPVTRHSPTTGPYDAATERGPSGRLGEIYSASVARAEGDRPATNCATGPRL
jgi:hypothetical protein